jgi:hypothetical protein
VSKVGVAITWGALALFVLLAVIRLFVEVEPLPGYMKQNLASLRIVSFGAIAWLVAQAVRMGWVGRIAQWLPAVGNIGQQGLVCFVGGAVASNVVDTLLRLTHLTTFFPARLAGDLLAIAALVMLAGSARRLKAVRPRVALT